MMSNIDIEEAIKANDLSIQPFEDAKLQPCSYDMTLGSHFTFFEPKGQVFPKNDNSRFYRGVVMSDLTMQPGQFLLGTTQERVELGAAIAGRLEGKSSLGRLGLMVHTTAGFIDAGFRGQITLELVNLLDVPMVISAGMPIAQLSLFRLDTPTDRPYKGKYQDQKGATRSQYHLNMDEQYD